MHVPQEDLWFQKGCAADMAWMNRFMLLGLSALHRLGRWHTLVELGAEWSKLTCGAFNEKILPWLLQVCNAIKRVDEKWTA